jgi:hypothetical protein
LNELFIESQLLLKNELEGIYPDGKALSLKMRSLIPDPVIQEEFSFINYHDEPVSFDY